MANFQLDNVAPVPEPASLFLFGASIIGVARYRRRQR
jgi:hypothetical protein